MIVGITGGFGTGKTTVAGIFSRYGFKVINADKLYHGIYIKNKLLKNKIKNEFGTLDRNKIKRIVFNDYKKLKRLNQIAHPVIINEIKNKIESIIKKCNKKTKSINKKSIIGKNKKLNNFGKDELIKTSELKNNVKIVLDVPLLIEAGMQGMVDKIIVVKCSKKEQIKRLLKNKKHSKKEIERIIKSQMPLKEKIKYADFVVDNNRAVNDAKKQVKGIAECLSGF